MKNKNCLLLLFVISNLQGESQDIPEETMLRCRGDYKLLVEIPMYQCSITGIVTDSSLMVAEPGSLFTVVNKTSDDYLIIRFWAWKENQSLNLKLCYADSFSLNRKYFIVAGQDIAERSEERFNRNPGFTAGTVLIPFKLRLQKFDFSKDITLGPAAGIRFRISHYSPDYVNILLGMGITSVTIDLHSTNGYAEESSEAPALTPSVGFVFELNHAVQAGMFCGWDYVAHNDDIHFIYHGKTWISFGLGYSLISLNEEKSDIQKKEKPYHELKK
jgi:hypothetical protein